MPGADYLSGCDHVLTVIKPRKKRKKCPLSIPAKEIIKYNANELNKVTKMTNFLHLLFPAHFKPSTS